MRISSWRVNKCLLRAARGEIENLRGNFNKWRSSHHMGNSTRDWAWPENYEWYANYKEEFIFYYKTLRQSTQVAQLLQDWRIQCFIRQHHLSPRDGHFEIFLLDIKCVRDYDVLNCTRYLGTLFKVNFFKIIGQITMIASIC